MDVVTVALTPNNRACEFAPSFAEALRVMDVAKFLTKLQTIEKDKMNGDTIELIFPYMDMQDFSPKVAKTASAAAEGLVRAMIYHETSKIAKPRLEAQTIAQGQLKVAEDNLAFDTQMAAKEMIKAGAAALERKLKHASALINGLASERVCWSEDSKALLM